MVAQEVPTATIMALPHGPTGVADARRRLRTDLGANGVPDPVIDDAVLILSELISNSCRHARPLPPADDGRAGAQAPVGRRRQDDDRGIRASWAVGDDGLLALEVTDGGGPTRPRPSRPSLTAHGGRGLGIVECLAMRWGVRDAPGEVTVWVLLPFRGRHARREDVMGAGIGLIGSMALGVPLDLAQPMDNLG